MGCSESVARQIEFCYVTEFYQEPTLELVSAVLTDKPGIQSMKTVFAHVVQMMDDML